MIKTLSLLFVVLLCRVQCEVEREGFIPRKGLVLGFYELDKKGDVELTLAAQKFRQEINQDFLHLLHISGLCSGNGKVRVFNFNHTYNNVIFTNLGKKNLGVNELEEIDEGKENIRSASATAVKTLTSSGVNEISVEPLGDAFAAAEGAFLSVWAYDELKSEDKRKVKPQINLFSISESELKAWERGKIGAEAQNIARSLMEAPANVITPTKFAENVQKLFESIPNATVTARDKAWAEKQSMNAFLGVAQGSLEPPVFLEFEYKGAEGKPLAFVGKGITFDSGGISLKPPSNMDAMRADMGGAACTVAAIWAAAKLQLPIHLIGVTPLTENMPGVRATKPGDVHKSMSGKTIQVDNTDAEGRLILSDALHYTQITHQPSALIDLATLTGAMVTALGGSATGVFTNSQNVWNQMHEAGIKSGDRVWRMPLFNYYSKQMQDSALADVNNVGGKGGGSCTAAAFLREFVTSEHWMHMDIAGVMSNDNHVPYIPKGMSGRPVRTLIEFISTYKQP